MNRLNFIVLIVMLFIGNLFSELAAQNDSIVFTNDNYMVGEIKNLNQGVIQVETHFSDSDFKI